VDAASIWALIAKLGDDSYEQREAAQKRLEALGERAAALLEKAAQDNPDAEVRDRARQLLAEIAKRQFPVLRSTRVTIWSSRIALTPDGTRFVAVGYGTVELGDFETGSRAIDPGDCTPRLYWCVAVSADGKRAIAAGREQIARVFDLETGQKVQELTGHPGEIWGAALLPDGKRAVTGGKDKSLRIWDLATGKELGTFAGVKEGGVAFSPDGKRVVTSSFDKTVRVWEVASGRELKRFVCRSRMECAVFVNAGRRVLCAGNQDDPTLQLWDVEQGKLILRSPDLPGPILGIAPSPDGARAVTAGRDGIIRLWRWQK
jgi:hypothetical protein